MWGRKCLFHLITYSQSVIQGLGQELKQDTNLELGADVETWKDSAYWPVPHGLLSSFLIEARITRPWLAPITVGWTLPYQSLM